MKYDYVYYAIDSSFCYGDSSVCHEKDLHGFSIIFNNEGYVDISSLEAYGDYEEMNDKCKTLQELKQYIEEHLGEISEDEESTGCECFEELISFIDLTINMKGNNYEA